MRHIRIESFDGTSVTLTLAKAKAQYGKDELFEYLQGYNEDAVFFFVDSKGQDQYPVTFSMLGA